MEIFGTVTPTVIAGRLETCVEGVWHAVYDEEWSSADVMFGQCRESSELASP